MAPGPFIRLEVDHEMGILFAIEACSDVVADLFNGPLEEAGVGWMDEWLPELGKEAVAQDQLQRGEINFEQFKEELGMNPSIQ